ncbi:MAG: branched-chain amino acid aminotransferase [Balneolaceae bacterium]
MKIKTTTTDKSRISEINFDNLDFGRQFSDHMVEMNWENGSWSPPEIKPYGPISFTPALHVLHYGQAGFEGMKAFYYDEKTIHLFRPEDHQKRFENTCKRLCIPPVESDHFIPALEELIRVDAKWVPRKKGRALYIRPFAFSSEEYIAARTSQKYKFYIITSPVAAYYKEGFNPVKLTTDDLFVRAVKGGTGDIKAAGNYGSSFFPAKKAQQDGYTQILWLDAIEHKYVEEVGTMNIFFLIDGTLITPPLSGTILPGITRRSVIALAKSWNVPLEERKISIDDVFEAHDKGILEEVFGAGTAAVISPVGLINHNGNQIQIAEDKIGPFAKKLFDEITGIQYGEKEDRFGWIHKVSVQ